MVRNNPLRASAAHIGIIGHITKDELLRYLTATELANGFANRFLLVAVDRSKLLPFGSALDDDRARRGPRRRPPRAAVRRERPRRSRSTAARERWIDDLPATLSGPAWTGRRGDRPRRSARRSPRSDLRTAGLLGRSAWSTSKPRSRSGATAPTPPLDLRRQPRRPDRRRDLGRRPRNAPPE